MPIVIIKLAFWGHCTKQQLKIGLGIISGRMSRKQEPHASSGIITSADQLKTNISNSQQHKIAWSDKITSGGLVHAESKENPSTGAKVLQPQPPIKQKLLTMQMMFAGMIPLWHLKVVKKDFCTQCQHDSCQYDHSVITMTNDSCDI